MKKLDRLEGDLLELNAELRGVVVDMGGLDDKDVKVRGTLFRHVGAWRAAGAGTFALGVIEDGFKLDMFKVPGAYEEGNNKSFEKDREFAVEAVLKLVKLEILKEVGRSEVMCVNPLTVAINGVGKKRLCIDLSRCVNEVNPAPKFRIESTLQFL